MIKTINEVIEDAIIADGFGDQTVWEQAKRIIDALDAAGFVIVPKESGSPTFTIKKEKTTGAHKREPTAENQMPTDEER